MALMASAAPAPDHGYGAPSSGYHAPSSGYGAPNSNYKPSYSTSSHKGEVIHIHHHYNHAPKPTYEKPTYYPKPTYNSPSYERRPSYERGSSHDTRDAFYGNDRNEMGSYLAFSVIKSND